MKKICGYDLNGRVDRAARNWEIRPDGEEEVGPIPMGRGLTDPCIVQVGQDTSLRWLGGAQASLAPHGRGEGWGEVGRAERRCHTRNLLTCDDTPVDKLAAALTGLATGARFCAVAIDDHPATSERLQERLLEAMGKGKVGRGLLVWRSVLVLLAYLAEGDLPLTSRDGLNIGIVGHVDDGFTLQTLRLRQQMAQTHEIFAPERRDTAKVVNSKYGCSGLRNLARARVALGADLTEEMLDRMSAPAVLAMTGRAGAELVRNRRGDFILMPTIDWTDHPDLDVETQSFATLTNCDLVILETPTTGDVRAWLTDEMSRRISVPVVVAPETHVARGALEAARRFAANEPVYFDFLPRISTIVSGPDGAFSHDLIGAEETLLAGRTYRSPKPARLAIQAGQRRFAVHLRKELAEWPRHATVPLDAETTQITPVEVSVEQTPAAGRARIVVSAPTLSRQFAVDWDSAEEMRVPWDDLVLQLNDRPATIPNRLVLRCGIDPWLDGPRLPGLITLLEENADRPDVDWNALAGKLRSQTNKLHCISSDGDLPEGVPNDAREKLNHLTLRALEHVQARIEGRIVDTNDSLAFLTWQFRRAPEQVPKALLRAWDCRLPLMVHPFITTRMNWPLIYQGVGRTCYTEGDERVALARLWLRPVEEWNYKEETAAAAFLLSRSDTAPLLLERTHVEGLARRVILEFNGELRKDYTRLNYAPRLLGGLLRWRMKVKNGLVLGHDPLAEPLRDAILRCLKDFERRSPRSERFVKATKRYSSVLKDLLKELEGRGANPDLLRELFDD